MRGVAQPLHLVLPDIEVRVFGTRRIGEHEAARGPEDATHLTEEGGDRREMVGGDATGRNVEARRAEWQGFSRRLKESNVSYSPIGCQAFGLVEHIDRDVCRD